MVWEKSKAEQECSGITRRCAARRSRHGLRSRAEGERLGDVELYRVAITRAVAHREVLAE